MIMQHRDGRVLSSWTLALLGFIAASASFGAGQSVQAASPQEGAKAACSADLATFCQGIEAGGGKKMACLTANQAKLSAACAASVEARRSARAAHSGLSQVAQAPAAPGAAPPASATAPVAAPPAAEPVRGNMRACRTDMATLCSTVEAGGGRKIKCLMENKSKLSPECAAAVSTGKALVKNAKAACQDDAQKFCLSERGPARMQCLTANKAQLSPACATVVERRAARQTQAAPKQ